MQIAKWDDGFVLDTDPRRQDPLYYYLREGSKDSVLGVRVDPLYEEHEATDVSIRISPEHQQREAGMEPAARREMYRRIISVLLKSFPRWKRVTLHSPHLRDVLEHGSISPLFVGAGFSRAHGDAPNERTWAKG